MVRQTISIAARRTPWIALLAMAIALPRSGAAQTPAAPPNSSAPTGATQSADTAALVLSNQRVVIFRAPLGASSPAERAQRAAERIVRLAEQHTLDTVTTQRIPEGMLVSIGDTGIFVITPADVDSSAGATLEGTADAAAQGLRVVLAAEIEQRSLLQILRSVLLALVATAIFVVAVRALVLTRRWSLRRLPDPNAAVLPSMQVRGFTILSAHQLLLFLRRFVDLLAWVAGLFVAYVWLAYVLTRFAYSRPWGEALGDYLLVTITGFVLSALRAIPDLFVVVLIVIVTRWIARIVDAFFQAVEKGDVEVPWIHIETANPTRRIVVALLWLFAIVVAYEYLPGSDSDVFKGVSVFAGLIITLGSTGIVNQGMSGLVLMYSRALKPGDYVRVGDNEGVVTSLGMLSTKLRTNKREELTLPNAVVVTTTIKNYSRLCADQGVIVHTSVTIGYDTPWRQVHALLCMAAGRTRGLLPSPPPFVHQTALSDFYVEYQLNAYLAVPERRLSVLSELHGHIVDCFNEYGVQIMSPNYEGDPDTPKLVAKDRWFDAPATRAAESSMPASGPATAPDAFPSDDGIPR